ncbi:transcriptional regulator [Shewanella sairae]|uniref:Transcriptional regulator n=1 Tax=Shewanella sairae TaxID=190310 RepID=A0ABQ4P427_9GAMM|nr:FMN-binding negative transcriptional regulator [Shewanella sairae]MCL1128575.1 FMN-binding negative transcriptional regulator [Shewanella sairae]GIU41921.1 transcriptional regulator [Shewanella sairae]
MHIPDKWDMDSLANKQQFINEFGFATVVSQDLEASHLPLLLVAEEGEFGVLYGHFARSNSHWQSVVDQPVVAIFSGPHSYISPTWYHTQPAVPTWNYAAVHAFGKIELIGEQQTAEVLAIAIKKYEPEHSQDKDFIPKEYQQKLSKGIVGFKIVLTKIQGKEKLGQHRTPVDQLGVFNALSVASDTDAKQLFNYMLKRKLGTGN